MTLLQVITVISLFSSVIFIECTTIEEKNEGNYMTTIINHLNSQPNKVYNYHNGSFVKARQRSDIIELTVKVNVECANIYPGIPCSGNPLICTAFVQKVEGNNVKILTDVTCKPIPPESSEQTYADVPIEVVDQPKHIENIELSHETVSSEAETPFVAVRRDQIPPNACLGCLIDLNVNANGVTELVDSALKHLESERTNKYILVRVLRLQQQVVSGVKYILLAEMAPTLCEKNTNQYTCPQNLNEIPVICEIHYIEKPWLSSTKHIIKNNCTQNQEFTLNKNDQDNEIKQHVKQSEIKMSPSRLAELESQILIDSESMMRQPMEQNMQVADHNNNVKAVESNRDYFGISRPLVVEELGPLVIERKQVDPVPKQSYDIAKIPVEEKQAILDQIHSIHLSFQNDQPPNNEETTENVTTNKQTETAVTESNANKKSSEESAESSEESNVKNRVKRSCKQKIDDSDSSSSSSSDSDDDDDDDDCKRQKEDDKCEENNDNCRYTKGGSKKNDCDNNSNGCDSNKRKSKNRKDDDDSSSSSSSSSSESEEDNNKLKLHKRSIAELEKISLEEKPLVKELADYAAKTLDKIDKDKYKRVILQILGAKKLRLDGTYYSLILRMGVSQCLEDQSNKIDCKTHLQENFTKLCKVQIHVGDNDDYITWKLIKSQCQNIKKDEYDRNRTNYSRYRRALVGGPIEASVKDPEIINFVKDTLPHLDDKLETVNKHKLINILSVSKQVVAGIKYKIKASIGLSDCKSNDVKDVDECIQLDGDEPKLCDIIVWDRPWLKNTQYNLNCNDNSIKLNFEKIDNKRTKRQIPGGPIDASNDPLVQQYVNDGLIHLNSQLGATNNYQVNRVVKVSKQVVAGILYKITVDLKNGNAGRQCEFKIWDQAWTNFRQTNITCDNDVYSFQSESLILAQKGKSKREANYLGEKKYVIPGTVNGEHDPTIFEHIYKVLKYMDQFTKFDNKYQLKNILSVNKQTVAGYLYIIQIQIGVSDCSKYIEIEYCNIPKSNQLKTCTVNVWTREWLNNNEEYAIVCDDDKNTQYKFKSSELDKSRGNERKIKQSFDEFIRKFNKTYDSAFEYNYRYNVFKDNLNKIELFNKKELGTATYGVTRFADLTSEEFSKSLGLRQDLRSENDIPYKMAKIPNIDLPVQFDWRTKNAVTEVKNQGMCGSCWAFSTTGNVEGQYAIKYGKLVEFSEQELVDCDTLDQGCGGGLMDNAYRMIEKLGGLETEKDYPYDGEDEKCHFNKGKSVVRLSGALNISHNEVDMAKWLVANGPISIAINANAMQFYVGGVSHPWKVLCSPNNLDHGVLIVGFGVHKYSLFNKTLPFWIVKNSWGSSWGEQGYYRVYRGDGTCGLNQTPSSAIVA